MIVHQLFPEPVYVSTLGRALTKEELKTISEYKKKTTSNTGNITSSDNYVLENKTLKNLKEDIHVCILDYFDKVICTSNSIIPYITQSWINYTKSDQFHHKHNHQNSLVSGIFYISADKKVDSVTFYKTYSDNTIKLNINKYNMFNNTSFKFLVETGNILLFRSPLVHGVEKKKGPDTRISLSFNVFFKGTIGNKKELTKLILE
jgi:uncharacterized protein (TIGR02466 family)